MSYLSHCLAHMPSKEVRKIAARLFPRNATSWAGAANITAFLVQKLLDEDFLAGFLPKLNERELSLVTLLLWNGRRQGMPKTEVVRLLQSTGDDGPQETIASMSARGIVFASGYGTWGDHFLPEDLAEKLAAVLARNLLPQAVPASDTSSAVFSGGFFEDALTFMAYAHKNDLALTQKGTISKRVLPKILNILQFKENTADIPADYYYTVRFSLLLNYCTSFSKAVIFHGQTVGVQTDLIFSWLKEKPMDRIAKATHYIANFLLESCPNAKIRALTRLVLEMKENHCYAYAELAAAAHKLLNPFTCEGPEPEYYLDIMLDTGLLVEERSRDGERLVRFGFWSPRNRMGRFPSLPGEEDGFWVQPNFEVLAPPRLKPALRWQLEMVADPVKMDQTFTYVLTREAALRFFDRDGHVPDMIGFLEKHSKNPLPQNVLFTIREWGDLYGRVSFWDVFLLKCDGEQLADEIAANRKLKPYIKGRFDQNHLVIERGRYDALLAVLQKEGYFPRKSIVKGGSA
ncbi:MAG: helicase-associated domain-containing protein [Peptococcaceae bacterium]|jgi:hypothetical protein|nr:helicase-associated domain-containing protein [Peptococcaceae bacterium]